MIKVQQYIKNLTKSTIYGAAEVLSENFQNVKDFGQTNSEIGKVAYEAVKDYQSVFKKVKNKIVSSDVYSAAQIGIKSLIQDLTTGDFYNTEREQEILNKYGGTLLDDSTWDMDSDTFNIDDENLDMTDGEKVVATAIKKNSKISTAMISESVAKTGKAQIDVSRENAALLYTQNERMINKLDNGFLNITNFLTKNAEQNAKVQNKQIENTNKFFTNMEKNSNKIVAQLDELLQMQRNIYNANTKEEKKNRNRYSLLDIADNGIPDLKEYFGAVKKNINEQINETFGGLFSMGEAMGGANLLAQFASSPMRFLMTEGMKKLVDKDFKDAAKTFDSTFGSIFHNFIVKANTSKESNNPLHRILGNIFGLKVDKADSGVDTAKYTKGPIPFDGVTRQSIIEVIPSHLRKIESLLSGGDERIYDFKTGRWTSVKAVHKQHKDWRESYNADMKAYLSKILKDGLGKNVNRLFSKYDSQKDFEKDLNAIATVLTSTGDLASLNSDEFSLNQDLVRVIKSILRDDTGLGESEAKQAGGVVLKHTTVNGKKYKDNKMRMANKIATIYATSNRKRKQTHDEIESDPLSLIRMLYSEGIAGGESYNGYRTKRGDLGKEVFDSPIAKAMLHVKDDHGHTLYEYLRHMKMDLTDIRNNSLSFFRGGKRGSSTSVYSRNLMDFEKPGFNKPEEYDLRYREKNYTDNTYKEREHYEQNVQTSIQNYLNDLASNDEEKKKNAKQPRYAKDLQDLNTMVYELKTEQNMKAELDAAKAKNDKSKKTVWDILYDNGMMKKENRDKYNKVTYDSQKDMKTQLGELEDSVSKLALLGDYARQLSKKPWESATQALYKMDYWITSLFFGEDLKETDPDKEDDDRKGLFGIIKDKFKTGFDFMINKITEKIGEVMDDKVRPWISKILTPVKNFLFGERESSTDDFNGGLLSPFLNNVREALKKNSNDVAEYMKRLKEEAERKAAEAGLIDKENDDITTSVSSTSSSQKTQDNSKKKTKFTKNNPEHVKLLHFLIDNGIYRNQIWEKHEIGVERASITKRYVGWLIDKNDHSYLGIKSLWGITLEEFFKEEKLGLYANKKEKDREKRFSRITGKLESDWRRAGLKSEEIDEDIIKDQLQTFTDLNKEQIEEYIEWCKKNNISNDIALEIPTVDSWRKYIKNKGRTKAGKTNKRVRKNHSEDRNVKNEIALMLGLEDSDPMIKEYIQWCKTNFNLRKYDDIVNSEMLSIYYTQRKSRIDKKSPLFKKKLDEYIADPNKSNRQDQQGFAPSEDDDVFTLIEKNNKILLDKVASPLERAVEFLKRIADKLDPIPNVIGPNSARGGINKTGRPIRSVVSSGEIINGNVVPEGGPYLTTIPKNGIVINPANESTMNRQATQEKAFLRKIHTNAKVNDGLTSVSIDSNDNSNNKKNGLLNDKRTADTIVKGGIGGLVGLLLGHPLIGLGIGAGSSLHKSDGGIANALFGDFVQIDENGKVERKDNGLISQEIQKAVPDVKLGALIGGIAGLFTPFGPVGGLMIGSALGFAKNNGLISETLFGEEGLIKPDQVNKIKKALPKMGLGALVGSFIGPFGLVGNAILGASAGYVTSLDKFKEAIFGKEEGDGTRIGGLVGAIKKGAEPLKDFGKTMIDGLTDEIFGKKNDKGEREGGLFGMVKDHIVKPIGDGIKPLLQEGRIILRDGFKKIPKIIKGILEGAVGEQYYAKVMDKVKGVGKGALKVGKIAVGAKLLPFAAGAHAIKSIGGHFRKKQIRTGNADDMTAYERNRFRENSKMMMSDDDWAKNDQILELFSANNSYEDLEELQRLINFHVNGEEASQKEEYKLRKQYSDFISSYLDHKSSGKIMKLINTGKYDAVDNMLKMSGSLNNKETGERIGSETREELIKRFNELRDNVRTNRVKYKSIKESGRDVNTMLQAFGLDIDVNNKEMVDKLSRNLDREIIHMKAGLTDEEKRKKLEQDPNNPLNKNTTGLTKLNESIRDLIRVIADPKEYEESLRKLAIKQYNEELGIDTEKFKGATPSEDWIKDRVLQLKEDGTKNITKIETPEEKISKLIAKNEENKKKASKEYQERIAKELAEEASNIWDKKISETVDFDNPDTNGNFSVIIDYKKYTFSKDPKDIEEKKNEYIKTYCTKKMGNTTTTIVTLDNLEKEGFFKKLFNRTKKFFNNTSGIKFALGTSALAGLGGLGGLGTIAATNSGLLIGAAGIVGAVKLSKFIKSKRKDSTSGGRMSVLLDRINPKTRIANTKQISEMANKDYLKRLKNGEFDEQLAGMDYDQREEFAKKWTSDRVNEISGKRYQGFFGGIKNKIIGAKENYDRLKEKSSKSDKLIHAITETLPKKLSETWHNIKDDDKETPKWAKILFGVSKWVVGVPLLVGFMKDTVAPFFKNKVKPILLGEYNESTGEYEGGIASGIVNPIRGFFKDKFQTVRDWFKNEGEFANENSGFKGLLNNFKGLANYMFDKWQSGLTTILTTVLPPAIETVLTNLPDILLALGKGIVNGIGGLFKKIIGSDREFNDTNAVSVSYSGNDTVSIGGGNYGFNNTFGGSLSMDSSDTTSKTVNVRDAFSGITTTSTTTSLGSGGSSDTTHGETLYTPAERLGKQALMAATNGSGNAWRKGMNMSAKFLGKSGRGLGAVLRRFGPVGKITGKVTTKLGNLSEFILSGGTIDHSFITNLKDRKKSILKNSKKKAKSAAWETVSDYIRHNYDDLIQSGMSVEDVLGQIDDPDEINKIRSLASGAGNRIGLDEAASGIDKAKSKTMTRLLEKFQDTKLGGVMSKASGALSNAYNKLNNKVWDKIKDTGTGKVLSKVNDFSENAKKAIKSKTTDKVADWIKKGKDWIIKMFTKIFESSPFKKMIKESGESISKESLEKVAKESAEKIAKETVEMATKQGAKGAAKGAVTTACAAVPIVGWIIDAVFIIYDFVSGMGNWRNILQVNEAEGDWGDKLLAGLAKVMTNIPGLGIFLSEQAFATILIKYIGKVLFPDKSEELLKKREEAQEKLELYNASHNTELTLEEFNNLNKSTSNWYTRAGDSIGNFFMDKLGGGSSDTKDELEQNRNVKTGSEKVEKIRKYAESIVGRIWNKYGEDYIKEFSDHGTFVKLCGEVIDKVVILLNGLEEYQLEIVEDHITDIDGGILDFRVNGTAAWDAGYKNAVEYLGLAEDTKATKLIKVVGALASIFVKSFGGVGLKSKVMAIVTTVIGKAFNKEKDKALQYAIDQGKYKIAEVNKQYKTSADRTLTARQEYESKYGSKNETSSGGGGEEDNQRQSSLNTTTTTTIASNAKVNDKLTPINSNNFNILEMIGSKLESIISNSTKDVENVGRFMSKLINKNKSINKKIDDISLTPDNEKYWEIVTDSKSNQFASAMFRFNEVISRIVKAPFSLVTKTMGNSNSILASTVNSSSSATSASGSNSSSNNTSSANNKSNNKSGFNKILNGALNLGKKLFGWITGKGKGDEENIENSGRGGEETNPFHIYQRDYKGSYQTKGDTEKQTVADSGCGPAAAASVLRMYGKQGSMKNAVNYALNNNYKEVNGGTYPEYFNDYLNRNGIKTNKTASNKEVLQNLVSGKPVILMGRDTKNTGRTPYGAKYSHYVVARGLDRNGNVIVEDSEDPKGSTRYSLKDTLANSSIKITTSGNGKYGRGEEQSLAEKYMNNTSGFIAGMTSNIISSVARSSNVSINTSNSSTTSTNTVSLNSNNGKIMSGTEISVPVNVQYGLTRNYTNYDFWYSRWASNTVQRTLADIWNSQGRPNNKGIATIDGYYLVAMSPKFGTTGDMVSIVLDDGTVINAILADMKGSDATSEWGHVISNGLTDIIEWEACCGEHDSTGNTSNIKIDDWLGKKVTKVINGGSYLDSKNSSSGRGVFGKGNSPFSKVSNVSKSFIDNVSGIIGNVARNYVLLSRIGSPSEGSINSNTINVSTHVSDTSDPGDTEGRKKAIWNFFTSNGISENLTAAIMGNMQRESGFNPTISERASGMNITRVEDLPHNPLGTNVNGTGMGFGLIQWSYAEGHAMLYNWCTNMGYDPNTLNGQCQLVLNMVKGTNTDKQYSAENVSIFGCTGEGTMSYGVNLWNKNFGGFDKCNNESIEYCCNAFYKSFERGANWDRDISLSINNANAIYQQFVSGTGRGCSINDIDCVFKNNKYKSTYSSKPSYSSFNKNKFGMGKSLDDNSTVRITNNNIGRKSSVDNTINKRNKLKSIFNVSRYGRGIYGRDGENKSNNTTPNNSTQANNTSTTSTSNPTQSINVSSATQTENVATSSTPTTNGNFLSKFGSYINESFKAIYGPYWDALFGQDETAINSTGSVGSIAAGDPGSVLYAAAMVFEAMGRANPTFRYCFCGDYYYDITCADGTVLTQERADCSGMMSAVMHYMGYYTDNPKNCSDNYHGYGFCVRHFRNGTNIYNSDGTVSTDWELRDYDPNDKQPGDMYIRANDNGHIDMYVYTDSNGVNRGFNAGSGSDTTHQDSIGPGLEDSYYFAKNYLETGSFEGVEGATTIKDNNVKKIVRYRGAGGSQGKNNANSNTGSGRGKESINKDNNISKKKYYVSGIGDKGDPHPNFNRNTTRRKLLSTGRGNYNEYQHIDTFKGNSLPSLSISSSTNGSSFMHRKGTSINSTANRSNELNYHQYSSTTRNADLSNNFNFDSLLSILEIIAENSAKTEQMIQLLSAIVTNTAVLGNTNHEESGMNKIKQLISQMRSGNSNSGVPITTMNNMINENSNIVNAVYSIAKS